jgi:predicted Zn-dependent protease
VIRLVTLEKLDPTDVVALKQALWTAFGLGTDHAGDRPMPRDLAPRDEHVDAVKLLGVAEPIRLVADDKVVYLSGAALSLAPGPLGAPPCWGFAEYGGQRAVVSLAGLPARGATEASIEAWRRRLARETIHVIGHLWDLHHCYDPRCAMHPSWSPNLAAAPEADLCTFCREKSERKIRLAKS